MLFHLLNVSIFFNFSFNFNVVCVVKDPKQEMLMTDRIPAQEKISIYLW